MKKFIKRQVISFNSLKIDSGMSSFQLTKVPNEKKFDYEIINVPMYLPVLTLTLNTQSGNWKDRQIRITEKTLKRFTLCLRRAVEWFYDDAKKDMFLYDDNNDLTFNFRYKDLNEIYQDPFNSNIFMKILPSAIQSKNGKLIEGVNIYINQIETMVSLSRYDLEDLLAVMSGFSFHQEGILLLIAYYTVKNEPNGIINQQFYVSQQKMEGNLKAIPIDNRKNPFGV